MWTRITIVVSLLLGALTAHAEQWEWRWTPGEGEGAVTAEICPLRYDKQWAYAVEVDDGPLTALTVSEPFLKKYHYTDAPPGVPGGKPLPFVGSVAVYLVRIESTPTFLTWDQVRELQAKGWGIINHSYLHAGRTFGNWPQSLTPEEMRRDFYWSQTILATELRTGRTPSEFAYPNGYAPYGNHLAEFGFRGASRRNPHVNDLLSPDMKFLDMARAFLDETPWSESDDVLLSFPPEGPKRGQLCIDFTHNMDPNPDSPNAQRWAKRMAHIAGTFGQQGSDSLWCAPTAEIVDYALASRVAKVSTEKGRLTLSLPETAPGTAMTVKLNGIAETSKLEAPAGGVLYRQGRQVWVTTPMLGPAGTAPPLPHLKRIYQGPVKDLSFDTPQKIAGVRVYELGEPPVDFELAILLTTPQGDAQDFVRTKLAPATGMWRLYSSVPDRPAPAARSLSITAHPTLKAMDVWAAE